MKQLGSICRYAGSIGSILIFLALAVPASVPAADEPDSALPSIQQDAGVTFITGGIGLDEVQAMKTEAPHHSLALLFASRIGDRNAYLADIEVIIATANGKPLLTVRTDGPYLLLDLAPAAYRITASYKDKTKSQMVDVAAGTHQQIVFNWTGANQAE